MKHNTTPNYKKVDQSFQAEGKEQGIEVYYKDKTVWCTQKASIIQDRLFMSDFDRYLGKLPFIDETDTK